MASSTLTSSLSSLLQSTLLTPTKTRKEIFMKMKASYLGNTKYKQLKAFLVALARFSLFVLWPFYLKFGIF
jgi:hypothetical protein